MEKELSYYFNGKGKGAMSSYFTGMVSFSSLSFLPQENVKMHWFYWNWKLSLKYVSSEVSNIFMQTFLEVEIIKYVLIPYGNLAELLASHGDFV